MAVSAIRGALRAALDLLLALTFLWFGAMAGSGQTDAFGEGRPGVPLAAMVIFALLAAAFALVLAGQRLFAAVFSRRIWLPGAEPWLPVAFIAWLCLALAAAEV